jgi:outer membrane protein assembly factor BamB
MNRLTRLTFLPLLASLATLAAAADPLQNWPQWRGPLANGVAPQADPPLQWSDSSNIKWKVAIPGLASSTPVVWENRVFVLTAVNTGKKAEPASAASTTTEAPAQPAAGGGQGQRRGGGRGFGGGPPPTEYYQFVVLCLDRQTGKTLWQKTAAEEVPHEGHHATSGFASASPVTDGQVVLAYFGSRGLHCYDLEGNFKWKQDFGDMRILLGFGEGSSPALYGNTIVVQWDHEGEDFIAALDKNTGKELWRRPRDEASSWSTPLVVVHDGKPQVVATASKQIISYDLASGEPVWNGPALTRNVIPNAVAADGIVYAMSGYSGNALHAIKLGRTGNVANTDAILWSHSRGTPYVPSPLLYDDLLYFLSNNNGVLSCFDAKTGKPHFAEERLPGLTGVYASPVGAKNRVYVLGRDGTCVVLKRGSALEVLATNKLGEATEGSLALVGKEIFVRGQKNLYCIAEN